MEEESIQYFEHFKVNIMLRDAELLLIITKTNNLHL